MRKTLLVMFCLCSFSLAQSTWNVWSTGTTYNAGYVQRDTVWLGLGGTLRAYYPSSASFSDFRHPRDAQINALLVHSDTLFVATDSGLYSFVNRTWKMVPCGLDGPVLALEHSYSPNRLWASGYRLVQRDSSGWAMHSASSSLLFSVIRFLHLDSQGRLWGSKPLFYVYPDSANPVVFGDTWSPDPYATLVEDVTGRLWPLAWGVPEYYPNLNPLTKDSSGVLWCTIGGVLYSFDGDKPKPHAFGTGNAYANSISDIALDRKDGSVWTFWGGFSNAKDGSFKHIYLKEGSIPDARSRILLADARGGIWCISGDVLVRLRVSGVETFDSSTIGIHPQDLQYAFQEPDNTLWFIGEEGKVLRHAGNSWVDVTPAQFKDAVGPIFRDRSGNIWVGVKDFGVVTFTGNEWKRYSLPGDQDNLRLSNLMQDSTGTLWADAGYKDGIARFDGTQWIIANPDSPCENDRCRTVRLGAIDSRGELWVRTYSGVAKYTNGQWHQYWPQNSPLLSWPVNSLDLDTQGALWISTNRGVVRVLNENWRIFAPKTRFSRFLFESIDGQRWFQTADSIAVLKDTTLVTYSSNNAPFSSGLSRIIRDRSGTVWALQANGALVSTDASSTRVHPKNRDNALKNRSSVAYQKGKGLVVNLGTYRIDGEIRLFTADGRLLTRQPFQQSNLVRISEDLSELRGYKGALFIEAVGAGWRETARMMLW